MKKQIPLLAMMLLPMMAGAETVEIDGIYYELMSKAKQAEVKSSLYKYTGNVVIPASIIYEGVEYSVTSIGVSAFRECYDLTSIMIPGSLTSIKSAAFYECNSLTSVRITDIAAWCKISFNDYHSNPLSYAHHLYLGEEEIKDLVIPNSVTSIGVLAFSRCTGLTSVTIPSSVTNLGSSAFWNCSGLTSVVIPNSVMSIGSCAFEGCCGLTSITIPDGVESIERYTFAGCRSLTSIVIPNSVTNIGSDAFRNCIGLSSVIIPNSVMSIGSGAFEGCNGLTSLTIGSGVKYIYSYAFASCKELEDVYCLAENVPTMCWSNGNSCTDAFQDSYIEYATLHVPAESLEAYRAVEPWKSFGNIVTIPQKCATPIITFVDGKLKFSCETEGVEYVYEMTTAGVIQGSSSQVPFGGTYHVSVYATKEGYEDSDVVTKDINLSVGAVGDVNGDGIVDVADIATIISIMAGESN